MTVKAQIQFSQQFVGFGIHGFPVDAAKPVNEFASQENVFSNGELRDQVEFLVNNADTGFLGGFRTGKGGFLSQPFQ